MNDIVNDQVTLEHNKICCDYDEDCHDNKCPTKCWIGGHALTSGTRSGIVDSYCPMMFNRIR